MWQQQSQTAPPAKRAGERDEPQQKTAPPAKRARERDESARADVAALDALLADAEEEAQGPDDDAPGAAEDDVEDDEDQEENDGSQGDGVSFEFQGVSYARDNGGEVVDPHSGEVVGTWDAADGTIAWDNEDAEEVSAPSEVWR